MLPGMFPGDASAALADIVVTDEGDHAPTSGAGGSSHTIASLSAAGPFVVVAVTATDNEGDFAFTGATWNGVAGTLVVQSPDADDSTDWIVCALFAWRGAQSGNLVIDFNDNVDASYVTVLSLSNVLSDTPLDTGSDDNESNEGGSGLDCSGLSTFADGCATIVVYANNADGSSVTWTNATEVSDIDGGRHRHSVAYALDTPAGTINANGGSDRSVIAGAVFR